MHVTCKASISIGSCHSPSISVGCIFQSGVRKGLPIAEAGFQMAGPATWLLQNRKNSHLKTAGPQGTGDTPMLKSVNLLRRKN